MISQDDMLLAHLPQMPNSLCNHEFSFVVVCCCLASSVSALSVFLWTWNQTFPMKWTWAYLDHPTRVGPGFVDKVLQDSRPGP